MITLHKTFKNKLNFLHKINLTYAYINTFKPNNFTIRNFTSFEDELEEQVQYKDKKSREGFEDWKKKTKEMQEEHMRKVQEMVRRRKDESKRGNKEFLMKMNIPGVSEEPEK